VLSRIEAVLSPAETPPSGFAAVMVIDVIRATTTAAFMLNQGASRLLLAADLETARKEAARRRALLAGERGGVALPGFDLGNSPRQALSFPFAGREVVMTTSNGTVAAQKAARLSGEVALAALVNAAAAARWAGSFDSVLLLAAGREGRAASDDAYAIGAIISRLVQSAPEASLGEGAILASAVFGAATDARKALLRSAAARALEPVGLLDDVELCAATDVLQNLPLLRERQGEVLLFSDAVS